ncbi:hypothetical protein BFX06_07965 [Sulfobacillus thermosulfidooxidans]|nr:hypothetical protein BFX05_01455 [Sulfobacillus thermosulfidooxidans]OLZ14217.1 hypothetical protein BFX06_07965 [Sulfobacillus thermosulfidooxidans]OLZ18960.1 hypothetical protein BFX07_04360 [Sulfobacillus thermosulfidooxidans]
MSSNMFVPVAKSPTMNVAIANNRCAQNILAAVVAAVKRIVFATYYGGRRICLFNTGFQHSENS